MRGPRADGERAVVRHQRVRHLVVEIRRAVLDDGYQVASRLTRPQTKSEPVEPAVCRIGHTAVAVHGEEIKFTAGVEIAAVLDQSGRRAVYRAFYAEYASLVVGGQFIIAVERERAGHSRVRSVAIEAERATGRRQAGKRLTVVQFSRGPDASVVLGPDIQSRGDGIGGVRHNAGVDVLNAGCSAVGDNVLRLVVERRILFRRVRQHEAHGLVGICAAHAGEFVHVKCRARCACGDIRDLCIVPPSVRRERTRIRARRIDRPDVRIRV